MTFDEMVAQREREALEFNAKYADNPEKLAADLDAAIKSIESKGYIVHPYEDPCAGQVYAILYSDYRTVYGYGTCDAEGVMYFSSSVCDSADVEDGTDEDGTVKVYPAYGANQKKEREYDLIYNDGGEGYNPYRIGSAHTYD